KGLIAATKDCWEKHFTSENIAERQKLLEQQFSNLSGAGLIASYL
ncbi:MAG: hypothetical protein RLZZ161_1221, partial [Bacteroidota bacterium]